MKSGKQDKYKAVINEIYEATARKSAGRIYLTSLKELVERLEKRL